MQICTACRRLLPADAQSCPADGAPAEAHSAMVNGTLVGSYRVVRLLGEGGMGWVYEVTHEVLGRRAAMKVLRSELCSDAGIVARFLQEAKAVNVIEHDHVVNVYDYGDGREGAVYFVMEYLEGETLQDFLSRARRLTLPVLLHLFEPIARALVEAHAKGIIHRDLKPANVFVVEREDNPYFVKLLDFGVAKVTGEAAVNVRTSAGALIGTPQFMSPEQLQGRAVDARADIFALGVMMFRAVTGQLPWNGKNLGELARLVLTEPAPSPRTVAPDADCPPALETLIVKSLSREAADRQQKVGEITEGLAAIRQAAGIAPGAGLEAAGELRGSGGEAGPLTANRTGASLAASLPVYQAAVAPPGKPRNWGLIIGAVCCGVVGAAGLFAVVASRGSDDRVSSAGSPPETAPAPVAKRAEPPAASDAGAAPPEEISSLWSAGQRDRAAQAARAALQADLHASEPVRRERARTAIELTASPAMAPLLYDALQGGPDERAWAARLLADLKYAGAAPKLRQVYERSGEKLRVDIAAAMVALGDQAGKPALDGALDGSAGEQLTAATALARAGTVEPKARGVLDRAFSEPVGRPRWRQAAAALNLLGDASAHKALVQELAQADSERSLGAAVALADASDARGVEFLDSKVGDGSASERGTAALALARRGHAAALRYAATGLQSESAEERKRAVGVAARLNTRGGERFADEIADLIRRDPDEEVKGAARAALLVFSGGHP